MEKEKLGEILKLLRLMRDEDLFRDYLINMYLESLIDAVEEKFSDYGLHS